MLRHTCKIVVLLILGALMVSSLPVRAEDSRINLEKRALELTDQQKFQEAIDAYELLLQGNIDDYYRLQYYRQLAELYQKLRIKQDRFYTAAQIQNLIRAARVEQDDEAAAGLLFQAAKLTAEKVGEVRAAIVQAEKIVSEYSGTRTAGEALFFAARQFHQLGDFQDSLERFQTVVRNYSENVPLQIEARLMIGDLYAGKFNNPQQAEYVYQEISRLFRTSESQNLVDQKLLDLYSRTGQQEKYHQILERLAYNSSSDKQLELLNELAISEEHNQNYEQALEIYLKLVEIESTPENKARRLYRIARILEHDLRIYHKKRGKDGRSYYQLRSGNYEESVSYLDRIINDYPQTTFARRAFLDKVNIYKDVLFRRYEATKVLAEFIDKYRRGPDVEMARDLLKSLK